MSTYTLIGVGGVSTYTLIGVGGVSTYTLIGVGGVSTYTLIGVGCVSLYIDRSRVCHVKQICVTHLSFNGSWSNTVKPHSILSPFGS